MSLSTSRRISGCVFFGAAFVLWAGSSAAGSPVSSVFCVGYESGVEAPRDCRVFEALPSFDRERPFIWLDSESNIAIGVTKEIGETIESWDGFGEPRRFVVKAPKHLQDTDAVKFVIETDSYRWQYSVEGGVARNGVTIRAQPGVYRVGASAGTQVSLFESITFLGGESESDTVLITLASSLRVTGVVLDEQTQQPLVGARVLSPWKQVLAVADERGWFSFGTVSERRPEYIEVTLEGYGVEVLRLPRAGETLDLEAIRLGQTATIDLVLGTQGILGTVEVMLRPTQESVPDVEWHRASLRLGDDRVSIEGITAGRYVIVARGSGAFEQHGTLVEIVAGERKEVAVDIKPFLLRMEVRRGDESLKNVTVTGMRMQEANELWRGTARLEEGASKVRLWQEGTYFFVAEDGGLYSPVVASTELSETTNELLIDVPLRVIEGVVVDLEGSPMASVAVELQSRTSTGPFSSTIRTDDDGVFRFNGVRSGTHHLTARREGYLQPMAVSLRVNEADPDISGLLLRLERNSDETVVVRTVAGQPISGAMIARLIGGRIAGYELTAPDGTAPLGLGLLGGTLLVFPAEGSMAIVDVTPSRERESVVEIAVPEGSCTIRIFISDREGRPISGVPLVMRVDGQIFPPPVISMIESYHGLSLTSGPDGYVSLAVVPPGLYEFWPIMSREDLNEAVRQRTQPPIRFAAGPGINTATVTLDPLVREKP